MSLEARKIRLIMLLRRSGISDTQVLSAIEKIPREAFVPQSFHDRAYENETLPIGFGQTLSQPQVVALMTQSLSINKSHKVLEIGTGSGYQAAILSCVARRVYTIERYKPLLQQAEERFTALRIHNIVTKYGDGSLGWPEQIPFDRIILTAAAGDMPEKLYQQLAVGGIMVLPIGPERGEQKILRVIKTEQGPTYEEGPTVFFVPLISGALPDQRPPNVVGRATPKKEI